MSCSRCKQINRWCYHNGISITGCKYRDIEMQLTKQEQQTKLKAAQQKLKEVQEELKLLEQASITEDYTLVPDSIQLARSDIRFGIMHRDKRLHLNDGIEIDNINCYNEPFKILHTSVKEFEDGKIYFTTDSLIHNNDYIKNFTQYGIYSEKDKTLYHWESKNNNAIRCNAPREWRCIYPVVPIEN